MFKDGRDFVAQWWTVLLVEAVDDYRQIPFKFRVFEPFVQSTFTKRSTHHPPHHHRHHSKWMAATQFPLSFLKGFIIILRSSTSSIWSSSSSVWSSRSSVKSSKPFLIIVVRPFWFLHSLKPLSAQPCPPSSAPLCQESLLEKCSLTVIINIIDHHRSKSPWFSSTKSFLGTISGST